MPIHSTSHPQHNITLNFAFLSFSSLIVDEAGEAGAEAENAPGGNAAAAAAASAIAA